MKALKTALWTVWLCLMLFVSKPEMHSFPAQHTCNNTLLPLLIKDVLLNLWGFYCCCSRLSWFVQMLIGISWSMLFTVHDLALNPWSCFLNVFLSHSQLLCASGLNNAGKPSDVMLLLCLHCRWFHHCLSCTLAWWWLLSRWRNVDPAFIHHAFIY